MTWIAVSDHDVFHFAPSGLGRRPDGPDLTNASGNASGNALMPRGSLVIETRLPVTHRPRHLLYYSGTDDARPLHLSLQVIPGGGLTLVLDQGGEVLHRTINHSEAGRTDILRITYSWDTHADWGRLALERTDRDQPLLVPVPAPRPLHFADALALVRPGPDRYVAPDVLYVALSDAIEPVGPVPSLLPDTPLATPSGYRPVCELRRGDMVLTPLGDSVPVLHVLSREVPGLGSFHPIRMRAPYFGLKQDITVAPSQHLVLSGTEVEYTFGRESVLVPARHLVGSSRSAPVEPKPVATYWQVLLPRHEAMIASGTVVESLFIGRLRRKKSLLDASILAGFDRESLPEHGRPVHPVLQAFEAIILAERRAA